MMSRRIECKNDIICARPRQKTTGTLCEQMCSLPFFSKHRKGLGVYLSNHGFYVGRGGDNCADTQTGQWLELGDTPEDLGQLK